MKASRASWSISSSVSRQSATKPGQMHVDAFDALARQLLQRRLGIGLQPLRLAEAALEGDAVLVGAQPQALGQQPRRLVAVAVVGVAELQRALGHAVEAHHQHAAAAFALPVGRDLRRQRADVAGVVVVLAARSAAPAPSARAGPRPPPRRTRWRWWRPNTAGTAAAPARAWRRRRAARPARRRCSAGRSAWLGAPAPDGRPGPGSRPAAWPAWRSTPPAASLRASRCVAYFSADLAGRTRRITPCRISHHSSLGISTTRGSLRNSAR